MSAFEHRMEQGRKQQDKTDYEVKDSHHSIKNQHSQFLTAKFAENACSFSHRWLQINYLT
jgi:hypothetical protein